MHSTLDVHQLVSNLLQIKFIKTDPTSLFVYNNDKSFQQCPNIQTHSKYITEQNHVIIR